LYKTLTCRAVADSAPTFREAGCNPMSTGILSDIFPEEKRGLVMSIFNWGIYGGYGIAFPVGRYVPLMNTWDLVSDSS
jgi:MFS family permease